MARASPFRTAQIDMEICRKIERIMETQRYRGSFASFVESVLEKFADGLFVEDRGEVKDIPAVKGRRISVGDQRKTA